MTPNRGIDYTFDATGNTGVMRSALEASHRGWGKSVVIVSLIDEIIRARAFYISRDKKEGSERARQSTHAQL